VWSWRRRWSSGVFDINLNVFVDSSSNTTSGSFDNFGFLGVFLVNFNVESNEQEQVRRDNSTTVESGDWRTNTVTTVRQRWEKVENEFLVGGKVDETNVQDELNNLKSGDPFFPPNSDTSGSQIVVPVHDTVDGQIQCDWDPRNRSFTSQLSVTQQSGGTVMISVQKS